MENIIYIHGANASSDSFNYYLLNFPEHNILKINYSMDDDPFDIVDSIKNKKQRMFPKQKVHIIGHSFGGLLASWYASVYNKDVKNLITIATPWEGTPVARIFGFFWRNAKVFQNTKPGAEVLEFLQDKSYNGKHINIVCTRGANPVAGIGGKANDGMITCDSQSATPPKFKNTENTYIEAGHSEVLLNNNVTDILQKIIFEV